MSADPFTRAALGQREAQAAFVGLCMGLGTPLRERLAAAEVFARLAAEHGIIDDLIVLAGVLTSRAADLMADDPARATHLLDEVSLIFDAIAEEGGSDELVFVANLLSAAADSGDMFAALSLDRLVAKLSPTVAAAITQCINRETAAQAAE